VSGTAAAVPWSWRVLEVRGQSARGGGVLFLRIPRELQRPMVGACACDYCAAHPLEAPTWDTLAVPTTAGEYTYAVHLPGAK